MSICGTIATDGLHDNIGLELWVECIIFFVAMVSTFAAWYYVEHTLDVHSIDTYRKEGFYWLTVFFTFALGTAVGDGISEAAMLGYGPTFGIFVAIITFFATLWYFKVYDDVTAFWLVYIMTRPLGASLGDLISAPKMNTLNGVAAGSAGTNKHLDIDRPTYRPTSFPAYTPQPGGGANLGYAYTSVSFIFVILVLVTYMTVTGFDQLEIGSAGKVVFKDGHQPHYHFQSGKDDPPGKSEPSIELVEANQQNENGDVV